MELKNKIALVTGAAHRVGRVIAEGLAEAGAHIVLHHHHADPHDALEAIRAHGVRALPLRADLTQPAEIESLFDAVESEWGGPDILINSAGVMEALDVLTLSRLEWERNLGLNLTAPLFCAQRAAHSMLARTGGVIVNIADASAFKPWVNYPAQSVSKAGLVMLTQVLAKALAPRIRVNALALGFVLKPDDESDQQWQASLARHTLLKRAASGYDVAHAVRFLIENDSITGETLVVDSGSRFAP